MICSLSDLKNKEVVDVKTGEKLGYVDDIEISTENSQVTALIVYGRPRGLGLFGRDDDIIIKCRDIHLIGEDTILVKQSKNDILTKTYSIRSESL